MSSEKRDRLVVSAIGVVFVLSVAYSVLIIGRLLPGLGLVIPLVVLYLLWRLVRAAERIADAVEDDAPGAGRSAEEESSGDNGPGVEWDDAGTTD